MHHPKKKSPDQKVNGPVALSITTAAQAHAFGVNDSHVPTDGRRVDAAPQYLTIEEVAGRYQISRSTVWSWARTARYGFPKPANLTPSCTRWQLSDLLAWEQHQLSNS